MIITEVNVASVLKILESQPFIVIDVETDGLDSYSGNRICGIGIGIASGKTYYFPFRHKNDISNLPSEWLKRLIKTLNKYSSTLVGYNIKFDLHMLMQEGLNPWDKTLIDVIVMARFIEKERTPGLRLSEVIDRLYGPESSQYDKDTKAVLKKNKWNKDFSLAPINVLGPYCEEDVKWTQRVYMTYGKAIRDTNQEKIWKLQIEVTKVLLWMEQHGVFLDKEWCAKLSEKLDGVQRVLEEDIYKIAGKKFDILSSPQVGQIFNSMGIKSPEKTPAGKESWNETALYQIDHEMAGQIKHYRSLEKLNGTYLRPYKNVSFIHPTVCNWGTITGRYSVRDPNTQNITRSNLSLDLTNTGMSEEIQERVSAIMQARKGQSGNVVGGTQLSGILGFLEEGTYNDSNESHISVRRIFVPRNGSKLVTFDYSQMEVRVFLYYVGNKKMLKLMEEDKFDFHSEAAKLAFKVTEDHPNFFFFRQMGKAITFGLIYGIGIKRLAAQLNMEEEEAASYRKLYFENIEGSKEFIDNVKRKAANRGYVTNLFGRKYFIPEGKEYVAVNYLVQGSSADLLSSKMVELYPYCSAKNIWMILQVHDELMFEIPPDNLLEEVSYINKALVSNEFSIPLVVESYLCDPSWAHKVKI